ncbi:coiled-coil domain-containing protein 177 [Eleginops maclovinus]|uniref:coiled-coil domain-containing protein 177 n=1 Tax=Eleginops maclovinus TaxID=56733 RepID=UPI0030800497
MWKLRTTSPGFRLDLNNFDCAEAETSREPDRSRVCSLSLGDLRYTPATDMKLERLTRDINKEMCVTLSEKDRKIAALMLVKHQEEQASLKRCQREEQDRQEARRQDEAQRADAEKQRRKKLRRSMQRWQEDLKARRRLKERKEKEKAVQLELDVVLHEDRWRRQKEEVEEHHREKIKAAHREAEGRKRYQDKLLREREEVAKRELERERQVAEEKEQRARRNKVSQEREERRRLQEGNRKELLRHILLKQKMEQQVEEEVEQTRSTFERKMRLSCDKHAQAVEARVREVQVRAAQEEMQIQRAQLRAKLQSYQEHTHKQILVQLSQRRLERAGLHAEAQQRCRAQQAQQHNQHRQTCHLKLRERVQREEEEEGKVRESCIFMKDMRSERLRRQREQIQEEAHRLARASFHMRERVRQHTHSRTFDQMDREAQLTASMSCMKI